jgi:hypothetical protein
MEVAMQFQDRGAGRLKAIIVLLFFAAIIYTGVKILPVYVQNYQLSDYVRSLAVDATVAYPPATADGVTDQILRKARDLGLPVTRDDVQVTVGRTVTISVDYRVPIDLTFYKFMLHFTPSAKNTNLT